MILWYGELDAMAHEVADKVRDSAHTSLYTLLARHCQSKHAMNFACLPEGGTSLMAASLGRACRKAWGLTYLRHRLWDRLGLSILLGHEEFPKVLIDNLGGQLHSILLICK